MGSGMRCSGLKLPTLPGRGWWRKAGGALLILGLGLVLGMPSPGLAAPKAVEVRNLGISRVGERTMITVILNLATTPRVSPFTGANRAQVVIEFPQAQATKLPEILVGDEILVKDVRTEVSSTGVKIIVEMFPERPYLMSRELLPLGKGLVMFRLGLRPDPDAAQAKQPPAAVSPVPAPEQPYRPGPETRAREEALPVTPATPAPTAPPVSSLPPSQEFAELYQLVPQATGLWDFLRGEGFTVTKSQNYDSPGKQFTRGFHLTSGRYPQMKVRVANLPPSGPGAPSINIIDLSMENLEGKASEDYKKLRTWSFSQIKSKYEDIGDFFEDALKPLRLEIRKKCQDLAQRHAQFIANFLRQAVPQNPKLGDEAITLIRKKVSPRFEGVQYTLSETPLVILNLVDFLYIRVYYLGR